LSISVSVAVYVLLSLPVKELTNISPHWVHGIVPSVVTSVVLVGGTKLRPTKFKAHFNRVNMQRKNPNVWTVHHKGVCHQGTGIKLHVPCTAVFKPEHTQPRAWFEGYSKEVRNIKGTLVVL